MKFLALALKSNQTLKKLDLSDCKSGCGFESLGDALAINSWLQLLNLDNSICADSDVYQLAMGLRQNHLLTKLYMKSKSGGLTPEGMQRIETLKHYNTTLQCVYLYGSIFHRVYRCDDRDQEHL